MANARIRDVNTHLAIEPPEIARRLDVTRHEIGLVRQIQVVATNALGPECCHEVRFYRPAGRGRERDVVLHWVFVPRMPVGEAHQRVERLEQALRARIPGMGSVLVHVEPMNGADGAT
ncbi:MAG TPA: cation transporter dimerization domain-containing protein [Chloroflexota bacterium]|nr:cation transporter dimerization domain-containing protein [Chloroflexota bacterium]